MTPDPIDNQIEAFISSCINSVEQFEILLLLRQHKTLDTETINRELRTTVSSVEKRLFDLTRKNLVTQVEENGHTVYQYDPHPKWAPVIDQLAGLYASHRVSIINLIFSKPQDALKSFSEAFRLREKDK